MQVEQLTVPRRRKNHRFIERPRLLRSLDASKARVRLLIAPAGFGKTTLAEQWTRATASHVAWYPSRIASSDVAALSVVSRRLRLSSFRGVRSVCGSG